jgi:dipeptidyl aminopeptidase/acylaminoacyl peptidase
VNCVVDNFGPVDIMLYPETTVIRIDARLFGGTAPTPPACSSDPTNPLCSMFPLYHLSPTSAPTMVVQGTLDPLVPPAQSDELIAALQANGVANQSIYYSGGHQFTGLSMVDVNSIYQSEANFLTRLFSGQ